LRAYAALPKAVRTHVHVGGLHLGHLAKAFGLAEPPSRLGQQQSKRAVHARTSTNSASRKSEYLAGAEYLPREQRAELRDGSGKAKAKGRKALSLSERMKRQPKGGGGKVGAPIVSEFGAG
jgi:hypothetical protein